MGKIIKSFLTSCKIKLNKIRDNLEPIGLSLILISFGWQCFEENSNSSVYENHILNINEKLNAIWTAEYDEIIHTERYQKECQRNGRVVLNWFNYESANQSIFKDWKDTKEELNTIESQRNTGWIFKVILYVIGSIFIILPKIKI